MSVAVRIVGKTGSDVSFSCFPLAGKAVLYCRKCGFVLRKRLFYGVEKAVLRCEKGSFGLRKRLFGADEGWMMRGCVVYVAGCQTVVLNVKKSRICGRSYYVSVLKHSRGVVVGCFSHFCVMISFSVPYVDVFLFGCSGGAVCRELISSV